MRTTTPCSARWPCARRSRESGGRRSPGPRGWSGRLTAHPPPTILLQNWRVFLPLFSHRSALSHWSAESPPERFREPRRHPRGSSRPRRRALLLSPRPALPRKALGAQGLLPSLCGGGTGPHSPVLGVPPTLPSWGLRADLSSNRSLVTVPPLPAPDTAEPCPPALTRAPPHGAGTPSGGPSVGVTVRGGADSALPAAAGAPCPGVPGPPRTSASLVPGLCGVPCSLCCGS